MPPEQQTFEQAVTSCYEPLYRFALGLSRSEADAADLTQRAFERFGEKSGALRDPSKVKTWLFTTLYRDFLQQRRHATRFPQSEIDESIESTVGHRDYARLRVGVGAAESSEALKEHVLEEFAPEEMPALEEAIRRAADAVECWLAEGTLAAMNRFNRRVRREESES